MPLCRAQVRYPILLAALSIAIFAGGCRGRTDQAKPPVGTSAPPPGPDEPSQPPVARPAGPFRIGCPSNGEVLILPDASRHRGIVIRTDPGASVRAAGDGEVAFVTESYPGIGPAIVIEHTSGYRTVYGPVRVAAGVAESVRVRRGDRIGRLAEPETLLRFRLMRGDTDVPNIFDFADFEATGELGVPPESGPGRSPDSP
jgi:hypothetical protein